MIGSRAGTAEMCLFVQDGPRGTMFFMRYSTLHCDTLSVEAYGWNASILELARERFENFAERQSELKWFILPF